MAYIYDFILFWITDRCFYSLVILNESYELLIFLIYQANREVEHGGGCNSYFSVDKNLHKRIIFGYRIFLNVQKIFIVVNVYIDYILVVNACIVYILVVDVCIVYILVVNVCIDYILVVNVCIDYILVVALN